MYATERECENEKPNLDATNDNAKLPNLPKLQVQSGLSTEETWNTLATARECSREIVRQTEEICDVTNTYSEMEPDVETSSEQPNSSPTNPRSSKYNLRHNLKPNCNDDFGY